jgi:Hydrazine synthase alpha subunit middle domain
MRLPLVWIAPLTFAVAGVLLAAAPPPSPGPNLPPIVFVERFFPPSADSAHALDPRIVPGLGPHGRDSRAPCRLMLREPDGAVRQLAGPDRFFAVAHPSVSRDARTIVCSGLRSDSSRWELWELDLTTRRWMTIAAAPDRDFVQPCWISDSLLCAVSIDAGTRTQYTDLPVSGLVIVDPFHPAPHPRGSEPREENVPIKPRTFALTHERNGAETPCFDPTTGRIVYSRWWFNRWRASDDDPRGITAEAAHSVTRDTVNLWQIVSIRTDGTDERVEASGLTSRLESMGYGPAVLSDGSIVATYASNLGLSPRPGLLGIQRFSPRIGHAERLIGALVESGGSRYGTPHGLAAPAAYDPAALPDGRILFSYDPGGHGDFALYVMDRDGSHVTKVYGTPGSTALDAAPIVAWRAPKSVALPADTKPVPTRPESLAMLPTFRFFDRDVFAGAHGLPGVHAAPPRTKDARIRFWATLPRPTTAGGDTAVLVREVPVGADGSVDERVPAGVPMFEQIVGGNGRVLRSVDGPAHVAGLNTGAPGMTVTCVGCHTGHSVLERGRIHPARR